MLFDELGRILKQLMNYSWKKTSPVSLLILWKVYYLYFYTLSMSQTWILQYSVWGCVQLYKRLKENEKMIRANFHIKLPLPAKSMTPASKSVLIQPPPQVHATTTG